MRVIRRTSGRMSGRMMSGSIRGLRRRTSCRMVSRMSGGIWVGYVCIAYGGRIRPRPSRPGSGQG